MRSSCLSLTSVSQYSSIWKGRKEGWNNSVQEGNRVKTEHQESSRVVMKAGRRRGVANRPQNWRDFSVCSNPQPPTLKPHRACHARCIVVLSPAISLSVSQQHYLIPPFPLSLTPLHPTPYPLATMCVNLSTHITHTHLLTQIACTQDASRTSSKKNAPFYSILFYFLPQSLHRQRLHCLLFLTDRKIRSWFPIWCEKFSGAVQKLILFFIHFPLPYP